MATDRNLRYNFGASGKLMLILFESPVLLGAAAFLAGTVFAYMVKIIGQRMSSEKETGRDRQIRSLEADLRVARKGTEEAEAALEARPEELAVLTEETEQLRKTVRARDKKLGKAKNLLNEECAKTAALRKKMTGLTEKTIRVSAELKSVETELGVVQAGSDVVAEEFHRLASEREEETDRLKVAEAADREEPMLSDDIFMDS